jgi:hypothetical protein
MLFIVKCGAVHKAREAVQQISFHQHRRNTCRWCCRLSCKSVDRTHRRMLCCLHPWRISKRSQTHIHQSLYSTSNEHTLFIFPFLRLLHPLLYTHLLQSQHFFLTLKSFSFCHLSLLLSGETSRQDLLLFANLKLISFLLTIQQQ